MDGTDRENEEQKGAFVILFCAFTVPNQRPFLFFNLYHVSISHGPNRKQMGHAEEIFKESLKGLFQSCLMRGLFTKAGQGGGKSVRDS